MTEEHQEIEEVVEPVEDEEAVVAPEADTPEVTAQKERARRMGWRPAEEFAGDKSRWVDYDVFLERGEATLPILRERFRKVDEALATTQSELRDTREKLADSQKVLVELRDLSRTAEERAYNQAKRDLAERQKQAVRDANEQQFDALEHERQQLENSKPKPVEVKPEPVPAEPRTNPVVDAWIAANPWFTGDRVLNQYAIYCDGQVKAMYPEWTVEEQLAETKKMTMEKFPERFPGMVKPAPAVNARRAAPPMVATSSAAPLRSKGKTVKDLPAEARAALDRFKKTIPGYKDEEYLKVYFQGEE